MRPPIRDGVPTKAVETSSSLSPIASKIWAPWYEDKSEIPIFERILSTPASSAFRVLTYASPSEIAGSCPFSRWFFAFGLSYR